LFPIHHAAAATHPVQEAAEVSVMLGAFKLLMTLVAVATVDKVRCA